LLYLLVNVINKKKNKCEFIYLAAPPPFAAASGFAMDDTINKITTGTMYIH
jgi:hypothetical protein